MKFKFRVAMGLYEIFVSLYRPIQEWLQLILFKNKRHIAISKDGNTLYKASGYVKIINVTLFQHINFVDYLR